MECPANTAFVGRERERGKGETSLAVMLFFHFPMKLSHRYPHEAGRGGATLRNSSPLLIHAIK